MAWTADKPEAGTVDDARASKSRDKGGSAWAHTSARVHLSPAKLALIGLDAGLGDCNAERMLEAKQGLSLGLSWLALAGSA